MPSQIPYIIGNEGCERFSFYGMRNVLTPFLVTSLLLYLPEGGPPGGGQGRVPQLRDRRLFLPAARRLAGRPLPRQIPHDFLALAWSTAWARLASAAFHDSRNGFYFGLFLIALGSGGIKPCVSAFVGDQFDKTNRHLAQVVYDAFYWIINFGSFFASLLVPYFLKGSVPRWPSGVPGVPDAISTVILVLGRRKRYVMVPPSPPNPHSFLNVARTALFASTAGSVFAGVALLQRARRARHHSGCSASCRPSAWRW